MLVKGNTFYQKLLVIGNDFNKKVLDAGNISLFLRFIIGCSNPQPPLEGGIVTAVP